MLSFPWYRVIAKHELGNLDVSQLSDSEFRVWQVLRTICWDQDGLPLEEEKLARLAGRSLNEFIDIWDVICPIFFKEVTLDERPLFYDSELWEQRAEFEIDLEHRRNISEVRRAAGKRGAASPAHVNNRSRDEGGSEDGHDSNQSRARATKSDQGELPETFCCQKNQQLLKQMAAIAEDTPSNCCLDGQQMLKNPPGGELVARARAFPPFFSSSSSSSTTSSSSGGVEGCGEERGFSARFVAMIAERTEGNPEDPEALARFDRVFLSILKKYKPSVVCEVLDYMASDKGAHEWEYGFAKLPTTRGAHALSNQFGQLVIFARKAAKEKAKVPPAAEAVEQEPVPEPDQLDGAKPFRASAWLSLLEPLGLDSDSLQTWLAPLRIFTKGETVLVVCPSSFYRNWIRSNYAPAIEPLLKDHFKGHGEVVYCIASAPPDATQPAEKKARRSRKARPAQALQEGGNA